MGKATVRIVPNMKGIRDYLKASKGDPAMIATLQETSTELAKNAGYGFEAKQMLRRKNRPGFIVYARYPNAKAVQVREARLQKAVAKMSRKSIIPGIN